MNNKYLYLLIVLKSIITKNVNFHQDFSLELVKNSVTGWTGNISEPEFLECLHGNVFGPFQGQAQNNKISKTFKNLPPHYEITISIVFWALYSWNPGDKMFTNIDEQNYFQKELNLCVAQDMYFDQDYYCKNYLVEYQSNNSLIFKQAFPVSQAFTLSHIKDSVKIEFFTNLTDIFKDEAFGLSLFNLSINQCHLSCLSCNGPDQNNCTQCPQNSELQNDKTCKCNNNLVFQNHQCVSQCQNEYILDNLQQLCIKKCDIENCEQCNENQECITCKAIYYLNKGNCIDKCPWYSQKQENQCVDIIYNEIPSPYIVAEDFTQKNFIHSDAINNNWQTLNPLFYDGIQYNNYVSNQCNGLSLLGGFVNLPNNNTCSNNCGYTNTYNNLPYHDKVTVKYQIWFGEKWNGEEFWLKIDNQEVQKNTFTSILIQNSQTYICGRNNTNINQESQILNKTVTVEHTSSTLQIEIGYRTTKKTWEQWAAYREIQIVLDTCESITCKTCNQLKKCTSCIGDQGLENSRLVDQQCNCPIGYFDNQKDDNCLQCEFQCLSCKKQANDCQQCKIMDDINRLILPPCTCKEMHFENQNKICQKCLPPCFNCTNLNTCTSCISTYKRNQDSKCECQETYFDDGNECIKCKFPCKTCIQYADQCLTCLLTNNRNQSTCKCREGYYENEDKDDCLKCNINCKTCQGSADNCIQCAGGIQRSNRAPKCGCLVGFYDDEVNVDCQKCTKDSKHISCISCKVNII